MAMKKLLAMMIVALGMVQAAVPVLAQGPLQITITDGVIEPLPVAVPTFQAETAGAEQLALQISRVVVEDLVGSGLFREVPASSFISPVTSFAAPIAYADWRAINVQGLVTGAVSVAGDQLVVKFRLYDVFSGAELGDGLQFAGTVAGWRRMGHKVAMRFTAGSRARAGISTAGSCSLRKAGRREPAEAAGDHGL